ncbi:MAG: hypothetical protein NT033_03305, partial [Candidatus Omnitrophica bacterium]|nr:hypothetical protein [Candidatus Omnitrophota bacterium]
GLLIGTKTVALPYSALLFIPFLFLAVKNRCTVYLFTIFIFLVFMLGGFTYLKNFIFMGNPLYPFDLRLFGRDIFKGVMDAATYAAHFEAKDYKLTKILFHEGLGGQTLIFILPSIFIALPATIIKKRFGKDYWLLYILALPILLFLIWRFLIPLANVRYLYPLLGIGMVVAFYLISIFNIPLKVIKALSIICVIVSVPELAKRHELFFYFLLCHFYLNVLINWQKSELL